MPIDSAVSFRTEMTGSVLRTRTERMNRSTISGSNWPTPGELQRRSSAIASDCVRPARQGWSVVIESYASATARIRDGSDITAAPSFQCVRYWLRICVSSGEANEARTISTPIRSCRRMICHSSSDSGPAFSRM